MSINYFCKSHCNLQKTLVKVLYEKYMKIEIYKIEKS